jgi:hypothetical protein
MKTKKKRSKFKFLSIVVFDPDYAKKYPNAYNNSPIKLGEQVLYLGEVPNAIGHCAVAKHSGEVVWLVHPQDFRKATEDEL